MGIYDKYILPEMIHFVCSRKPFMSQRKKIVPLAKGHVLEIGIGSGLNLQFYDLAKVDFVWGLDPSSKMLKMAAKRAINLPFEIKFIKPFDKHIPLESNSVNTVLITYTMCTIQDLNQALKEMNRVLQSKGELIFCEHGLAPDEEVQRWQDRINPVWKRLGGGCNLNRPILSHIKQGGFKIKNVKTRYISGWRPASFNYWGSAVKR